jgi:predicted dienelactone hydrolase
LATVKTLVFTLVAGLLLAGTPSRSATSRNGQGGAFNVGLRIVELEYRHANGRKQTMAAAVWYPTETPPHPFTYHAEEDVQSRLATNAPVALKTGPHPLVVFAHGAYGSGYNSAFFTEHLASRGYVVVAPDYDDMAPPGYTRQIAFSRIKDGNTGHPLRIVAVAGLFVADMNRNRDRFFAYLAEHRLPQTTFVVDEMLRLNNTPGSLLHGAINERAIGICGHSLGGATALGKIGGHPDARFKDGRLNAALIFSAPVFPWEDTLKNITPPLMVMAGDEDAPALGPELPRRILYDKANPPKFYLVLSHATHFAFANRGCGGLPTYQAVEKNPQTRAICRYGLAFFEKFLRKAPDAGAVLDKQSPEWACYAKEERPGQTSEWGKEPLMNRAGGPGGIRKEIGEEIRKKLK